MASLRLRRLELRHFSTPDHAAAGPVGLEGLITFTAYRGCVATGQIAADYPAARGWRHALASCVSSAIAPMPL